MADVIIVGAGFGGLSAAIALASAGRSVVVLEAAAQPGGKASTVDIDGVRVDTGPSVLTLPHVIDDLLTLAGTRLEERLQLRRLDPAFRYVFDDGVVLDVHHELERTLRSVGDVLGSEAEHDLARFLDYARRIWDVASPPFVFGDAPTLGAILALGPRQWSTLTQADPLSTMWGAIRRKVRSEHVRAILARYATYNGSDPRRAPATLNCIAHVELGLGGFGVTGGLAAVVQVLADAAAGLGVDLRTGSRVARVTVEGRRVTGVEIAGGGVVLADSVVVNADAAHLAQLLPRSMAPRVAGSPSMSGYTAVLRARPTEARAPHTVLIHSPYLDEFRDVFDRDRPPEHPTVYLCDQHACHGADRWSDGVPLFMMANAPAQPTGRPRPPAVWDALRERMLARGRAAGLLHHDDPVVWERTPAGLAERFPGSRGSLYGAASNGLWSAFRRPANVVPTVDGLFLASGSAHPGGGVPLAILSGRAAARRALAWRSR